jgi:hypothetical protein
MASSMVSPVFSSFTDSLKHYASNECGNIQMRNASFVDIFSTLATALSIFQEDSMLEKQTSAKTFASYVLVKLTEIKFDVILTEISKIITKHHGKEYAKYLDAELGWISKKPKEEFNIAYDIHFKNLLEVLDDSRPFTLIKALRLFTGELFKRFTGSYNPIDYNSEKVYYKINGLQRSSSEFIEYTSDILKLHIIFCKYTERLSEIFDIFKEAADFVKKSREEYYAKNPKFVKKQKDNDNNHNHNNNDNNNNDDNDDNDEKKEWNEYKSKSNRVGVKNNKKN